MNWLKRLWQPKFLNEAQIVEDVISRLSKADKRTLITTKYVDLIRLHHTFGQDIRNRYKMWDERNPYTRPGGDNTKHPDDMSFSVIQQVWWKLHSYTSQISS